MLFLDKPPYFIYVSAFHAYDGRHAFAAITAPRYGRNYGLFTGNRQIINCQIGLVQRKMPNFVVAPEHSATADIPLNAH